MIWATFSRLLLPESEWVHPYKQLLPIRPSFKSAETKIDEEINKLLEQIFVDCRLHFLWLHLHTSKLRKKLFQNMEDVDSVFQGLFGLLEWVNDWSFYE